MLPKLVCFGPTKHHFQTLIILTNITLTKMLPYVKTVDTWKNYVDFSDKGKESYYPGKVDGDMQIKMHVKCLNHPDQQIE